MEDYIKEFEKELENQIDVYLNQIKDDIKRTWSDTVQSEVYDIYDPVKYERTNQLRDMVTSKIEGNVLYVYADTDKMNYYSFERKDYPVNPEAVIHFVDVGHDTTAPFEGDYDNFNHYPPRHFLQIFGERVQNKYPDLKVEIVRDTPDDVWK
jgi:hypothetical protein